MDRAESTGLGFSLAGHLGLLAALSLGFASVSTPPAMNNPIEVSFVEDIGLVSAVPEPTVEPPAQSLAPEIGAPEEAASQPAEAEPRPQPPPRPAITAAPPKAVVKATPKEREAPRRGKAERSRGSRLGDDFLKGLGSEATPSRSQKQTGAVMSASAMASIVAAIQRQIQPCADRQVNPGPGANEISVKLNLRLERDGSLARRPRLVSTSGVTGDNGRYEERVVDLAIAAFTGCSPLRGLPDDLYETARGGWSNFNMNYKLPG